jgi:ABC-type Na+ transport system ATPase subunit NatA
MAQHKIFALDIEHKLHEPTVDVEGIGAMIDQMSVSMAASAKETVAAFAKLKSVLTEEQRNMAKDLWLQKKTQKRMA